MDLTAEEVLKILAELMINYLEELKDFGNREGEQFQYGEKTAYIECFEYIQMWEKAKEYNLAFEVEKRYPL